MPTQSYLLFRHRDSLYGIVADHIREMFPLPELTLLADAPQDIIGSLNWRGKLLPVMHLDLRLGQPILPCQLSDSVVVLEWQGIQVGMVVNQMLGVQTFEPSAIEPAPTYGREQQFNTAFIAGIAKHNTEVVMLLQPETLIRQPDVVATRIWEAELFGTPEAEVTTEGEVPAEVATITPDLQAEWQHYVTTERGLGTFYQLYCPDSSADERTIFRQRADALQAALEDSDLSERLPLAVIGWGDELFGIELGQVREFINIRQVTTIPCCPAHIIGNINLRGEIMTLVDLRNVLNLPPPEQSVKAKAVVVDVDDIVAGIPVDGVVDVAYVSPAEITEVPTTVTAGQKGYLQGMATYQNLPLSILNLSSVLTGGGLSVNQMG